MVSIAFLISNNKKKINYRVILGGLLLQFVLAVFLLKTAIGYRIFKAAQVFITTILSLSDKGAAFVFGESFQEHLFAFSVLPTIIFVSSISFVLFHLGILQKVVEIIAKIMCKVMKVSGSESLCAAANVFIGQTEAPLLIRPYLSTMTKSEILAMMTGGMATVAGGVLAAYVKFGIPAGHLITASLMGAPASLLIAKIIFPEIEDSQTMGEVKCKVKSGAENILDAACQGASEGLKLALNVAAMLIAFISLIALINLALNWLGGFLGLALSLEKILSWIFRPLAFIMGIPWLETQAVGQLLGEKVVINEFYAYIHLGNFKETGLLSPRSIGIVTYALCGFANFGSIAIQIGGIGNLAPERRSDFAKLGFKAFIGGNLASFMNACIAGLLM